METSRPAARQDRPSHSLKVVLVGESSPTDMRLNVTNMVAKSTKTTGKKGVGNNVANIGTAIKDIDINSFKAL